MGIITEIKFQKKNKKRVSVYVDGEFVTGLESIIVATKGIKVGDYASEQELIALAFESQKSEAFDKAIKYISASMRTEKEVRDNLIKKEYPKAVVDYAISKLKEYGYLNDEAYLSAYIKTYAEVRGVNRIKMELLNKGVDKELVENALEELDDQSEAAKRTAEKYIRTHKNANRQKLMQHLYSKGFTYSDISEAVAEIDFPEEDE